MKCPVFDNSKKDNTMEKTFAVAQESKVLHLKVPPIKETSPSKPQSSSKELTTVLLSAKNNTSTVHNKENNSRRDPGTLDDCLEDSGYLSLQNSHIDFNVELEDTHTLGKSTEELYSATTHQENTILSDKSPSKCQGKAKASRPLLLDIAATPVDCSKRKTAAALSSTPSNQHDNNLPILKFQQDVCEELAKNFKKNKKYDWSIIQKSANKHLLDRVIGRHMGLEYVDVFTYLLSLNMKRILNDILSLLGDLDLISCKKVSKTWRKIICEDKAAVRRCQLAEQQLRESSSSLRFCGLTRDVAVSRVVLSCVQTLASSSTPSSSSSSFNQSSRNIKRTATSQKGSSPQCSRFNEYAQAASRLKEHESLRQCRRCGSPAIHLPEVQRATCTRPSCLFDFCTCCQEAFHGSTPCRTVQAKSHFTSCKTSSVLPGSARSKKNLRRL